MRAAVLLAAVVALAGCGQSEMGKATSDLDATFARAGIDESYDQLVADARADRPVRVVADLARYDRAARQAAGKLGEEKVAAILAADATRIADVCGRCAAAIDRTRETL